MMVLLAMYTGKTSILPSEAYTNDAPTWLALKNEYDKYVPMNEEDKAKANAAKTSSTPHKTTRPFLILKFLIVTILLFRGENIV